MVRAVGRRHRAEHIAREPEPADDLGAPKGPERLAWRGRRTSSRTLSSGRDGEGPPAAPGERPVCRRDWYDRRRTTPEAQRAGSGRWVLPVGSTRTSAGRSDLVEHQVRLAHAARRERGQSQKAAADGPARTGRATREHGTAFRYIHKKPQRTSVHAEPARLGKEILLAAGFAGLRAYEPEAWPAAQSRPAVQAGLCPTAH